jgi:hypothetical protein
MYRIEDALQQAYGFNQASDEEWLPIKEYPGYVISNYGQVYSWRSNSVLNGTDRPDGFIQINLRKVDETHSRLLHQLVGDTFIECPDPSYQIVHINGDRWNNHVSNLEWVVRRGKRGEKPVRVTVFGESRDYRSHAEAARFLGVSKPTIANILARNGRYGDVYIESLEF